MRMHHIRKAATWLLISAMTLAPTVSEAANYQYFRLYGKGSSSSGPVTPPPQGALSYSVTGAAGGSVGTAYSAVSSVSGGSGAVAFSVYSGSLPPGLSLNPSTGVLGGVPTQAGSFTATLLAQDQAGGAGYATFHLTVSAGLAVSGAPSGVGTVGQGYAGQFVASGGSAPYSFSTTSSLPSGLTLSSSGLLSGTPSLAGDYSGIVIKVQDGAGGIASSAPFTLRIADPVTVTWTPADGQVGVAYTGSAPSASGGRAPYHYSLNGSVPAGLAFDNASGVLSGTPSLAGSYGLGVTAIDADGRIGASGAQSLVVAPGTPPPPPPQDVLTVAGTPPAQAQLDISYLAHFSAHGGSGTGYVFDLAGGPLPPGLVLDPATGTVSGSPSALGTYSGIQIRVVDSTSNVGLSGIFSIAVAPAPELLIGGSPSSSAQVGVYYQADFTGFDGTGAGYSFSSVGAPLPPGLIVSNVGGTGGMLAGTPSYVGTYSGLKIRVTDSGGHTADSSAFTITVAAPAGPAIAVFGNPPAGTIGTPYSGLLGASGGTGSGYAFSVSSGSLPPGVALAADGALSGTPTTAGSYQFAGQVQDSAGDTVAATFVIPVAAAVALGGAPAAATLGNPYAFDLTTLTSGGRTPYSYSLVSGALPDGMTLSSAGTVSSPGVTGANAAPIVRVVDADGRSASAALTFAVAASSASAFLSAPAVRSGGAISGTLSTSLSSPTWSFASTPSGVTLSASGTSFSGTAPTVSATTDYSVAATATNAFSTEQAPPFALRVHPALSASGGPSGTVSGFAGSAVAPTSAPSLAGLVGSASFALLKDGSAYGWLATDCPGLSFDGTSGTLSGTPSQACSVPGLTIQVSDSFDGAAAATSPAFGLAISAATAVSALSSPALVRSGAPVTGTMSTNLSGAAWSFETAPSDLMLTADGPTSFSGVAPAVSSATGYQIVAKAASGAIHADAAPLSLTVAPPLAISGGPSSDVHGDVGLALVPTPAVSVGSTAVGTVSYALLQDGSPVASLGALCPGLSFAANGVISGTPSATCAPTGLSIRVTDGADGATASTLAFAVTVNSALTAPSGSFTASAQRGTPYSSGPLASSGGHAPSTWSLASGSLPAGLTLDPATGVISGTPTTTGASSFTVKRTDALGAASSPSVSQTIAVGNATAAIALTSPNIIHQGHDVAGTLTTSLPNPTWTFTVTASSPPLVLAASGNTSNATFSGTGPAQSGSWTVYTVSATATSGSVSVTTSTFNVTVSKPLTFVGGPTGTISGEAGKAIASTASVSYANTNVSGTPPTVSLLQDGSPAAIGTVCPGLSLGASNGVISGTPTGVCSATGLTLVATDVDGDTAQSATFAIDIGPAQSAPTGTLAGTGIAAAAYSSGPLTTNGGTGPFTWSLATGSLPPGLSVNASTGVVSGSPTQQGTYVFALKVTDAYSAASPASANQTIVVTQTPSNNGTYAATGQIGTPYSSGPPATTGGPGTPPYSYLLYSGTLPPGLALNADGTLTGTPTSAGSYSFYVYLKDANNAGSATAGPQSTIVISSSTASGTLAATKRRPGAAISGTLTTSLPSPAWTFTTTPTSPSLGLVASGNTSSATFSGTAPAVSSQTSYNITAWANSGGFVASAGFPALVVTPDLTISGGPAAVYGTVNTAITASAAPTVSGLGNTATYALLQNGSVVSSLGSLCPGLIFSTTGGQVTGTPTATCSQSNFTIRVTDSWDNATATTSTPFAIAIDSALAIGGSPAFGSIGTAYSFTPAVSGGSGSYSSYAVANTSGTLAALGLSFSTTTGAITGTPTASGSWTGTVTVTDSHGATKTSASLTVSVDPAIVFTFSSPWVCFVGGANCGVARSALSGGSGTYSSYSLNTVSGALANGVTFSTSTGGFTGVATATGTWNGTVTVTDSHGAQKASNPFTIKFENSVTVTGAPATNVRAGTAYSFTPSAAGGSGTFPSFSATNTSGTLAALGLSFSSSTGAITGTPTAGTWSGTITATDSDGFTGTSATLTITIKPVLTISGGPSGTVSGTTGSALSATAAPTVSGLIGTASYALLQNGSAAAIGSLCPGLSFSGSTGQISGTASVDCAQSNFTIRVTDSSDSSVATTSSSFAISVTGASLTVDYLVVAGGGAGGGGPGNTNGGGGGGAGGMLEVFGSAVNPGSFNVVVGTGGTGTNTRIVAQNGGNSSFNGTSATGGGGGSGSYTAPGANGGSGGGGQPQTYSGGSGIPGQGNAGGAGYADTCDNGGGGGGAGAAGASATSCSAAGAGGTGRSSSMSGAATVYAGGGGGGWWLSSGSATAGAGGSGIGGSGGSCAGCNGGNGAANTGSGGGGGSFNSTLGAFGGNGADGIVIVRYPGSTVRASGGTITQVGGYTIHTFKTSGSFTVAAGMATIAPSATTVHAGTAVTGTLSTTLASPTWSVTATPASPAMTLTAAGNTSSTTFSGTAPSVASSTAYTLTATATSGSGSATSSGTVTVLPALSISGGPSGTVAGVVGNALAATTAPTSANLIGTASYALLQGGSPAAIGSLCPGLSFSASTGQISGTATGTCSQSNFTVRVTDSADSSSAATSSPFAISVTAGTASASLTSASTVRSGDAVTGTMSSNLANQSWSTVQTTPASPTLSLTYGSSTFSGTAPSVSSSTAFSFNAQVTNTGTSANATSGAMAMTVNPALTVSGGASGTVSGTVGTAITTTTAPTPSGVLGTASYAIWQSGSTFTLSGVCPGLSLNTATGVISGTPTNSCLINGGQLQVTDSSDGRTALGAAFNVSISLPTVSLIVAGGGAGAGGTDGGGGGGGGVLPSSANLTTGSYPVVVGAGGTANSGIGSNGGNSSFNGATAVGGGAGATEGSAGIAGGSGGGGGGSGGQAGGGGVAGQGNAGGAGTTNFPRRSGGGGGAGAAGTSGLSGTNPGKGGDGYLSGINVSANQYYGGGGAGGQELSSAASGGGGLGGGGGSTGATAGNGLPGTDGLGGGGGGASRGSGSTGAFLGGNGGKGTVIIRYQSATVLATGGTIVQSGGYVIHTFTSSGTFTVH